MKKILFALTMMASALALAAEPLGMVIDVQGGATVNDGGKTKPLDMLSYLNAQNEIQLSPGASMTVTWYAGAKELKFAGPARLKVEPAGIKVVQGGAAQERPAAPGPRRREGGRDQEAAAAPGPGGDQHARPEADDARAGGATGEAAPGRERAVRRLGGLRDGSRADWPHQRGEGRVEEAVGAAAERPETAPVGRVGRVGFGAWRRGSLTQA